MTLSWVQTYISAAHVSDDGVLHGHTWLVRVYWPYDGRGVERRREALLRVCGKLDHSKLPAELNRAEDIAAHLADLLEPARVDVWREAEGVGATWTP